MRIASNSIITNSAMGISRSTNPAAKIDAPATYHLSDDPNVWTGNGNVLFLDAHVSLESIESPADAKRLGYPEIDF